MISKHMVRCIHSMTSNEPALTLAALLYPPDIVVLPLRRSRAATTRHKPAKPRASLLEVESSSLYALAQLLSHGFGTFISARCCSHEPCRRDVHHT